MSIQIKNLLRRKCGLRKKILNKMTSNALENVRNYCGKRRRGILSIKTKGCTKQNCPQRHSEVNKE